MLSDLKNIRIEDYDYPLPDDRIAKFPIAQRDHSKLLCLKGGDLSEHHFYDLPDLLPENTLLAFNDTKVIHARLFFQKETGAIIEVFCLEPHGMDVTAAFAQRECCTWTCFIGNNKKWKSGTLCGKWEMDGKAFELTAERKESVGNAWIVDLRWTGGASFAEVIEAAGVIPLPPYLHREAEASDATRYQTVYAHHDGSVAAPTAGLHFTERVLQDIDRRGIEREEVTLHVGAGTFKPVKSEQIGDHAMHTEFISVRRSTLERLIAHDGHAIAIGTTSVRTLESLYYMGLKVLRNPDLQEDQLHVSQWEPYDGADANEEKVGAMIALQALLDWMDGQGLSTLHSSTQIIIAPGYDYKIVKLLVTNFHQPQSTLLLLVSAFVKGDWRKIYDYALSHDFRFLSYGDSSLLIP